MREDLRMVAKWITYILGILMVFATIASVVYGWQFEYNWADYYREASIFTKQKVYHSEVFENITDTTCVKGRDIMKYVGVSDIREGMAYGDITVIVDSERYESEYIFDLDNETILWYNATLMNYCEVYKKEKFYTITMNETEFMRYWQWIRMG